MAFQGNAFQQNAIQSGTNDAVSTVGQGGDPAPLPHLGLLLGASAGGNTVEPTTGHLTYTGRVPTITQPRSFTPTTGHLTLTGRVPTVSRTNIVAPATGHLTFTGYVPTITRTNGVTATTGHLTFTGYVPTVTQPRSIAAATGHLTLTGYVPTVGTAAYMYPMPLPSLTLGATGIASVISPGVGHLTLTGYVPTQGNQTIIVEWDDVGGADEGYRVKWGTSSGSYSWSADVATDVLTYTITSLTYGQTYYIRIYALVGGVEQDPSVEIVLTAGWCFLPTTGHLTLTGYVPTVTRTGGTSLTATTGHLTYTGYAAGITQPRVVSAATGHLTFAGYIPTITQALTVSPSTGSLYFGGYVPGISQTGPVSVNPFTGHLTFTGYAPTVTGAGSPVTTPPVVGGGKPKRRRHYVEIDGQYFEVRDHQHAVEILTKLHEAAKEAAPVAVKAAAEKETPVAVPVMRVVKPDYTQEFFQKLQAQVDATNATIAKEYASAQRSYAAWQATVAQQIVDKYNRDEEDDIESLIALGVI